MYITPVPIYFHSKNDKYLTAAAVQNFVNKTMVFSSSQILGLPSIYNILASMQLL